MEATPRSNRQGGADDAADLKSFSIKIYDGTAEASLSAEQLSEDYPRVVVHLFKVGLAITLVSTFYCFWPFCDSFAMNVLWGILTTAIVFEPTVGAALTRGLNRILATIVAAALGIGAHWAARLSGRTSEPILLGFFVFLIAVLATFARFLPGIKVRRWDHGLMLFNMTFCLTTMSGHPEDWVITVVLTRTSTIILGSCIAVTVCAFVFPSWSGMELHDLTATDMDNLGKSLQGFRNELLDPLQEHQTVLTSKHTIETLAYFAGWEPGHSKFRLGHPWKIYVTIGSLIRQCAYMTEAFYDFRYSKITIPADARSRVEELSKVVCVECGKSLREMASTLRKMTPPQAPVDQHLADARSASNDLRSILQSAPAEVTSLPMDLTECADRILEAVNELASLCSFPDETLTKTQGPTMQSAYGCFRDLYD